MLAYKPGPAVLTRAPKEKKSQFLAPSCPCGNLRDRPWIKSPPLNSNKRGTSKVRRPPGLRPQRSRKASQRICRRSGIPPPVPFIAPLVRWLGSSAPPTAVTLTTQRTSRNSQSPPTDCQIRAAAPCTANNRCEIAPFLFLIPFI